MLQEMKLEDALKKFLQGRKVLVMYDETLEADKPAFTVEPLEEIFPNRSTWVDIDSWLRCRLWRIRILKRLCIRWQHRKNCPPKSLFGKNQRQRL